MEGGASPYNRERREGILENSLSGRGAEACPELTSGGVEGRGRASLP